MVKKCLTFLKDKPLVRNLILLSTLLVS